MEGGERGGCVRGGCRIVEGASDDVVNVVDKQDMMTRSIDIMVK
jgi:hypothetical protein